MRYYFHGNKTHTVTITRKCKYYLQCSVRKQFRSGSKVSDSNNLAGVYLWKRKEVECKGENFNLFSRLDSMYSSFFSP